MLAYFCRKDGKHQDAEEFLGLYLDALDDELVELHTYISTHKPASPKFVEELEEGAQSTEGQTELVEELEEDAQPAGGQTEPVEELEEDARSAEGQTELGKPDYTVRR